MFGSPFGPGSELLAGLSPAAAEGWPAGTRAAAAARPASLWEPCVRSVSTAWLRRGPSSVPCEPGYRWGSPLRVACKPVSGSKQRARRGLCVCASAVLHAEPGSISWSQLEALGHVFRLAGLVHLKAWWTREGWAVCHSNRWLVLCVQVCTFICTALFGGR